ncbi:hypothetical protein ABVT39_026701 [Epinephelus coioides]
MTSSESLPPEADWGISPVGRSMRKRKRKGKKSIAAANRLYTYADSQSNLVHMVMSHPFHQAVAAVTVTCQSHCANGASDVLTCLHFSTIFEREE